MTRFLSGRFLSVVAVMSGLAMAPAARAVFVVNYNFEEQATGTTTLVTSTQNGVTATFSRLDGTALSIDNLSSFIPSDINWGARSLGNFSSTYTSPGSTIVINFSRAVAAASLQFGDFNGDDDTPVTLTAYSGTGGTGTALNSSNTIYLANRDLSQGASGVGMLAVASGTGGIRSLTFTSGGTFPGSLFLDNLSASVTGAVPEPSSLVMCGMAGVAGLAFLRRRRAA